MHLYRVSDDPKLVTWANSVDDGLPADVETPMSQRYLYSVYWSVTTLTTTGSHQERLGDDRDKGPA